MDNINDATSRVVWGHREQTGGRGGEEEEEEEMQDVEYVLEGLGGRKTQSKKREKES